MKFPQEIIDKYPSIYRFLLDYNAVVVGQKMLEKRGIPVIHVFRYEKIADLNYYRIVNSVQSGRYVYYTMPIDEYKVIVPFIPTIDFSSQMLTVVWCIEDKIAEYKTWNILEIEAISRHTQMTTTLWEPGCFNCKNSDVHLLKCNKCKVGKYCSKECQIVHWGTHKEDCRKWCIPL